VIFKTGGQDTASSDRHVRRAASQRRRFEYVVGTDSGWMTGNPQIIPVPKSAYGKGSLSLPGRRETMIDVNQAIALTIRQ